MSEEGTHLVSETPRKPLDEILQNLSYSCESHILYFDQVDFGVFEWHNIDFSNIYKKSLHIIYP